MRQTNDKKKKKKKESFIEKQICDFMKHSLKAVMDEVMKEIEDSFK